MSLAGESLPRRASWGRFQYINAAAIIQCTQGVSRYWLDHNSGFRVRILWHRTVCVNSKNVWKMAFHFLYHIMLSH